MKRLLGMYVILMGSLVLLQPEEAHARSMMACAYTACESDCPSQQSHITFCENHSTENNCSLLNGGCRPGAEYGCGVNQEYVYCNVIHDQ